MNIKVLDSWLKDYLKTDATPQKIAEAMSLTSVGIEKIEPFGKDHILDIEVTTNRPDLMSVVGLAREAATVLPHFNAQATFQPPVLHKPVKPVKSDAAIKIINDPKLVSRVCAVIMDVTIKETPKQMKDRLESSGIRSLNNLIDVTNYVMRTIGHPTHVFDFDRLNAKTLTIRESKKGEKITTLDGKHFTLPGGDIIAVNEKGDIVDLLGIMGLQNSVVTDETKRIMFFIDNNDPLRMRKTSMHLALRSEAVQMNEKSIDAELAMDALIYGIQLYQEVADGKVVSDIIDIYPQPYKEKTVTVTEEKINQVIGITVPLKTSAEILTRLGFGTTVSGTTITATVPSFRAADIDIPEDLIEEVARIYGYHNIPPALPLLTANTVAHYTNDFFWENKVKDLLKHWGFSEVYTYSLVHENLFEGELADAVTLQNPLNEDMVYMRKSLVPSLLQVINENKARETIKIFEIANVYLRRKNDLPDERLHLAGILKKPRLSFFEVKGLFEQLTHELGIRNLEFKPVESGSTGAEMFIGKDKLGEIEILDENTIDFECDFRIIAKHATMHKTFTPLPKYPALIEDMSFTLTENTTVGEIITAIKKQSTLIKEVTLLDKYKNSRTFRIVYQNPQKNITGETVAPVREKIAKHLKDAYQTQLK
jgi:phenylalanyl-tRNA synthetase beta chain